MRFNEWKRGTVSAVLLMGISLTGCAGSGQPQASLRSTPDYPEQGKQGETLAGEDTVLGRPYSVGVDVVGRSAINDRRGNLAMAWSGHCAYVADGISLKRDGTLEMPPPGPRSGVAVIDVQDASAPKVVRYLQDKGSIRATETLHAVTVGKKSLLAASTYGGVPGVNGPPEGWMSVYDVSKCAKPRMLAEVKWPEPAHTITISPSGRFVYGTVLNPFTGDGGIQIMDISNPSAPRFVGKFEATAIDGKSFPFAPHELVFSPDEKRIYVGVVSSKGGDLNRHFKATSSRMPSAESVGQDAGGVYIFDNSDFAQGKRAPKLRLVGTAEHAGWHSPVRARIGGRPHIVSAGELGACPGAWPRITDISDEKVPRLVGEFKLAMNKRENCPEPDAIEKATGGMVGRSGIAASHFQDVDSAENTRLGLFSFMFAGLRIVDLRSPDSPKEIAYFKPGDACMSHVRYLPASGHIWLACSASGFYVIKLKREVRASFALPTPRIAH